ncbi:MAG: endonuclease/exonuclease/phosphatase family protein [Ilumatobacteraceae bacterium]
MRTEPREWAVMTWNLHGAEGPDLDAVADVVRSEEPDVVALQEVRRAQAEGLAQRLGMRFTWAEKHSPYSLVARSRAEGMAIMTPHSLDAAGHTEISDGESKRSWRRRIAQSALVGRDDATGYRVYNLHLSPGDLATERRAEAVRAATVITGHGESPPAIVAGDFNDDDDPTVIFALPGIEHVPPPPATPAAAPGQVLDHVLLPADADHVAVSVPGGGPGWAELSDHLPVTVRFTIDWVVGDFA